MKKFLISTIILMIALIGLTITVNAAEVSDEATFETALSGTDETITLTKNIELSKSLRVKRNVTVDLNGYKLTGPDDGKANWYAFIVDEGGILTLKDTSAAKTGEIYAKCYGVETKSGKFVMESGKITATKNTTFGAAVVNYGGKVEIKGGTLIGAVWAVDVETYFSNAELVITGGSFETTLDEGVTVQIGGDYSKNGENVAISGGSFKGKNTLLVVSDATLTLTGGEFTQDVSEYVSAGYVAVNTHDDVYNVKLNKPQVNLKTDSETGAVLESKEDLEKLFEKDIKEVLLDGKSVIIDVKMDKVEEKDIKEEEIKSIKEAAKDGKLVGFYDISLLLKADGEEIDKISETSNKLKFKVLITEDLLKDNRTFFMYRYHNGKVEKINGEINEENYFVFESDKFSTYVLAYEDKIVEVEEDKKEPVEETTEPEVKKDEKDETPKTGSTNILVFASAIIAVLSVAGTIVVKKYSR